MKTAVRNLELYYGLQRKENLKEIHLAGKIMHQIYEEGLAKTPANYEPLSPLAFLAGLQRYPEKTAIVYEEEDILERISSVQKVALVEEGGFGDTVAAVLPNIPE